MERFFGDRKIALYASGTAALAQAMANCASQKPLKSPEVIIPAYGCPDLVAACVHASVFPRLVDVAPSHWSYDLGSLESSLSANTAAVVAVNLLGLGDGCAELIRLCKGRNVPVIQDSAQHLPRERTEWPGDYIVLSFGRGKPLNLLHGGALVSRLAEGSSFSVPVTQITTSRPLLGSRAAAIAFNTLTRPLIYGAFSALPGTGLGEVSYTPLANPCLLPERSWRQIAPAFELFRQKPSYRRDIWASATEEWSDFGVTPLACPGSPLPAEPLRLALLAPDRAARDVLVGTLNHAGLGASRFYGTDLTGVSNIPDVVKRQGPFPHAAELAARLFTLPTHELISADTVRRTREIVFAWHRCHSSPSTQATG